MSHGALSQEAHETLAIGMNRIKGASCSGEGGEDSKRFKVLENGDCSNSRVKQIASARFGVTIDYLNNCNDIEIKIEQLVSQGTNKTEAKLQSLLSYAVECAIMKINGSEVIKFVSDEAIQIHGGYGYFQPSYAERAYRDAKVTEIYEGTSEIQRLVIARQILKDA